MSVRQHAAKQTKSAEEKKFSPTIITNFLNNHYRNATAEDEQSIVFKNYPTKSDIPETAKKFIIDLYDYQGLIDFITIYKQLPNEEYTNIIERIFDLKLHACLDIADKYKTNDKKCINVFKEFVIPQLGFGEKNTTTIQSYINAISSFFENDTKLKTKIYNSVFPHDTHRSDELPKGVNVIYLQHISKYHEQVLDYVIEKGKKLNEVLIEIQKDFTQNYKFPKTLSKAEIDRAKLQLLNQKIIELVINPPMIKDKHGNNVIDNKWIDNLCVLIIKKGAKQPTETDELINLEERKLVKELVRELMIVKSFVKIINGSQNARKLIKKTVKKVDADGNERIEILESAEPMEVNLKACLKQYKDTYKKTVNFYNTWKKTLQTQLAKIEIEKKKVDKGDETDEDKINQLIQEEEDRLTYELFLRYFIESVKFVKDTFNYSTPLKTFTNDIKSKVVFKFNKTLRAKILEMIDKNEISEDEFTELAREHCKDWMFLNSPKTYDTNDLNVYSKIGKFCGVQIKKDYRIAIGIAIVSFIQEKVQLIKAAHSKKHEIQIYIKA